MNWLIGFISLVIAMGVIFGYAPSEASQGIVQKIFYVHVSSAFLMYLGFFIAFVCGLMFLFERKSFWDKWGSTGAELGFLFCCTVLTTGPIWAKPIWGTYWTWEPRLTTTFLLWLMYAAYFSVRNFLADHPKKPLISAILAMLAFINVPLIHYSVKLWRGIHPQVINNKDGGLPSSMQMTLGITFLCLLVWFVVLFKQRLQVKN